MKFFIVLFCLFSIGYAQEKYRFCVYEEDYPSISDLERGNSEIIGIRVHDSVECALKLSNNEADFGVFNPEQVHLISSFANIQHQVLAELRGTQFESRNSSFQTVVVVRRDFNGNLNDLKGKKYCHPGFAHHDLWSPRVRKQLEYTLFQNKFQQICDKAGIVSYAEKQLHILNDFFGDSCRPGPWVLDNELDNTLKKKFSKLCRLCDNPIECTYNDNNIENTLKCLTNKNGDVAITTLNTLYKLPNIQDYKLLCYNNEIHEITKDIKNECIWRNQPWSLVVGRSDKASNLQNKLREWIDPSDIAVTVGGTPFSTGFRATWQEVFGKLLTKLKTYKVNLLRITISMNNFLSTNNQKIDLQSNNVCPMRWCTISAEEEEKCNWLAKANLYAGVEPPMTCVTGQNVYDCLRKIKDKNADIMAIDSNFGYLARKNGINNVLYSENSPEDVASIVTVLSPDSSINSINELKGKKACFPEYRGIAWISFIETAREKKLIADSCNFEKSLSNFFSGACVPGINDENHYRNKTIDYPNLCSLCPGNCESTSQNDKYDNKGALRCLLNKVADVAFVEYEAIKNDSRLNNFKVICKNNARIDFVELRNNMQSCPLSQTIDSEIIARNDDPRKVNYKLALLQMDELFGTVRRDQRTFGMFNKFKDQENLIFKSNVVGFGDKSYENQYVQNYAKLFEKIDVCTGGSWSITASYLTIMFTTLCLIFARNNL